jgi:hypothetical protein
MTTRMLLLDESAPPQGTGGLKPVAEGGHVAVRAVDQVEDHVGRAVALPEVHARVRAVRGVPEEEPVALGRGVDHGVVGDKGAAHRAAEENRRGQAVEDVVLDERVGRVVDLEAVVGGRGRLGHGE